MSLRRFVVALGLAGVLLAPVSAREIPVFAASTDAASGAAPAVVLLMRHAEKPEGDKDDIHLTAEGYRRARMLPELFSSKGGRVPLPRPDAIFATEESKHSNRPMETITPLAQALKMNVNHDFADRETKDLAKVILGGKYSGKVVLVCWHHGELPHLAEALGLQDVPKWNENTYDQIWRVDWSSGTAKMTVLHEMLLEGDSKP